MNHELLWREFELAEQKAQLPRTKVVAAINQYQKLTGHKHSLCWRTAFIALEAKTSYRVDGGIEQVDKDGMILDLLAVVEQMLREVQ